MIRELIEKARAMNLPPGICMPVHLWEGEIIFPNADGLSIGQFVEYWGHVDGAQEIKPALTTAWLGIAHETGVLAIPLDPKANIDSCPTWGEICNSRTQ